MSKNKNKIFISVFATLITIATFFCTYFFTEQNGFKGFGANLFLFVITLLVVIFWGISILNKISSKHTQIYFFAILICSLFWIVITMTKYFLPLSAFSRYLWYLYYAPMILIPTFWLLIIVNNFLHIHSKKAIITLLAVAIILILLVLTNDLNSWTFIFKNGIQQWNKTYSYGFLYFFVYGYIILCIIISFGIYIFFVSKEYPFKKYFLSICILVLMVAYSILYIVDYPLLKNIFIIKNLTLTCILFSLALMESGFATGVLQNAGNYKLYFYYSQIKMAITDKNYNIQICNQNFDTKIQLSKIKKIDKRGNKIYKIFT